MSVFVNEDEFATCFSWFKFSSRDSDNRFFPNIALHAKASISNRRVSGRPINGVKMRFLATGRINLFPKIRVGQ